jgi:hypothetical protein
VGKSDNRSDKSKLSALPAQKVREILCEVDALFEEHPELNLASPESLEKFAHRLLMTEWVKNVLVANQLDLSEEQTLKCVDNLCEGLTESVLRDPVRLNDHLDSALGCSGLVFVRGKWRRSFSG